MILRNGTEITRDNGSVKFGRDGMAEYLWGLTLDGGEDRSDGDVNAGGWFAQFGRRVVWCDEQGSVWVNKYDTKAAADDAYEAAAIAYCDGLNDVTCSACGTDFASEDGACWCCGARNWTERVA